MNIKELYQLYQQHPQITTDSRDCPEGSIFLALKGASFNGNQFALAALQKGCAYAIVDEDVDTSELHDAIANVDERVIRVDNCLQTFKDLAREHRRQFQIPVVAITGTNGKTTTKELVSAVLAKKYRVLATQGNFNNDVGVPKTLFRLNSEHQIAVIEMGASHPGDIKTLAETAEPTCGLITNVGRAHLQGFGSLKGVIKTKGELYDYLAQRKDGLVFINADNEDLIKILHDSLWAAPYSQDDKNGYDCIVGEVVACDPLLRFRWHEPDMRFEERGQERVWHEVKTHLIGAYNLDNLLAAIAVGINFGVEPELICQALQDYVPSNNRSQLQETQSNHLVVDAYNANPTSMEAAIDNFRIMQVSPKMAILGDMLELGEVSHEEHQRIVNIIKKAGFDRVWLVGKEFGGCKCHFRKFPDVEQVKQALAEDKPQGYYILIKGSNSMRLWQLPEAL
jgi:UDP-N-acetylmuramoyl-tripeptide--D-alanyl-D-alanine ligase